MRAGVHSGMRWMGVVLMLALSCGCSKAEAPNDPSSKYADTVWVSEAKGIELHLGDGDATLTNHATGKSAELTYTVDAQGNVLLAGEAFKTPVPLVPEGNLLVNRMKDLAFRQKTNGDDDALAARETERENAEATRSADRPGSLAGYHPIKGSEILLLIASRMPTLTDTDLANAFIPGYSTQPDAFEKQELLQAQLPAIKARVAELAKLKDFRINTVSWESMIRSMDAWKDAKHFYSAVEPYDMSNQTFRFTGFFSPCSPRQNAEGLTKFMVREWDKQSNACQIKVIDQAVARQMEAARSNSRLEAGVTMYVRFTGERVGSNVWTFDAHRIDVTLYLKDLGTDTMSPLGGPYTLTDD